MPYVVCLIIVVADQLSKAAARRWLATGPVSVIPGVFQLNLTQNPGAAFGLLVNRTGLFIAITVAVLVAIVGFGRQIAAGDRRTEWGLALVAAGAVGNLIDRVWRGTVTDFLDFYIWPIFNLADMAIVGGAIIIATTIIWRREGAQP
ncbi:MAG: signal peptidase II [Bacillota bacterium]